MEIPAATRTVLEETAPDVRVACIGPGGEKKVLFASVMNDVHRAAGRSGVGAVMGSKKIKAIVVTGDLEVPMADVKGIRAQKGVDLEYRVGVDQ